MEFEGPRQIGMFVLLGVALIVIVLVIFALQGQDPLNLSKTFGFMKIFG